MNPTLDSWISGGSRRAISGSSHELFVRQDGPVDGKPVTLFHGFPASSFDWAGVVPDLTGSGYRVTTLDFLGYIEASAHTMACSPTASWSEYLDLAGAVLTEPLLPAKGKIVARGPGLGLEWDEKAVDKYAFQ